MHRQEPIKGFLRTKDRDRLLRHERSGLDQNKATLSSILLLIDEECKFRNYSRRKSLRILGLRPGDTRSLTSNPMHRALRVIETSRLRLGTGHLEISYVPKPPVCACCQRPLGA